MWPFRAKRDRGRLPALRAEMTRLEGSNMQIATDFMRDFSLDAVVHDHKIWPGPDDAAADLLKRLRRE